MTNSEISLAQLHQVSGSIHGRDGCVDLMLLKLILYGQLLPGPLRKVVKDFKINLAETVESFLVLFEG